MVRRLIINADDYGLCAEVNSAVEQLVDAGRLRDVSVLANGQCLNSAIRFLQSNPEISIGVHLNAVEGLPVSKAAEVALLTDGNGRFAGLRSLLLGWIKHPKAVTRAVEIEWRAQLERLVAAGINLSHADSHQHVHAFPLAWNLAVKLCREYGIPSLRLPREINALPLRRAGALAMNASLAIACRATAKNSLRHNDHFLGFKRAGAYDFRGLVNDLRKIPAGVTELALHPSIADNTPYPNLFGNRERQALLDPALPQVLAELEIELITWRNLAQ